MLKNVLCVVTLCLFYGANALANGALAIDSNQGSQYGFSYNQSSMSAARSRALNECGSSCSVVKSFSSGCAAYAADQSSGSTAYGWGTGSSSSQAKSNALSYCRGSNCIVRAWGCNSN